LQNIIILIRVNLQVWDERQNEFDQLIHAPFLSLLQLKKALEAHQLLVNLGADLDTAVETPLLLGSRRPWHEFHLVEKRYRFLLFPSLLLLPTLIRCNFMSEMVSRGFNLPARVLSEHVAWVSPFWVNLAS
jgi:hypothetical protein